MADAYIGEIRLFPGKKAPTGWALCNGQLMPINANAALYSILGIRFGGDGKTTFALPNFQGMVPMGMGSGQGLTPREVGKTVGEAEVTLLSTQMPSHTHIPQGVAVTTGTSDSPKDNTWGQAGPDLFGNTPSLYGTTADTPMSPLALSVSGGSQAHNNMQPFLALNFIICIEGLYPVKG